MTTQCFSVVRGKRVRVTELDACGIPVIGGSFAVSDGFIQVAITAELESGDEFIQKNANGALCINDRSPDALKRLNVIVDWCRVDPDVVSLITINPVEVNGGSGGDVVGFRIQEGSADTNWGLEVWTGLGGDACGDDVEYGYLLIPYITGATLGDITVENGAATFQTTGYTHGNSGWGVGPYEVIGTNASPTVLDDAIGATDHALLRVVSVDPPAAACGAQVLTSP